MQSCRAVQQLCPKRLSQRTTPNVMLCQAGEEMGDEIFYTDKGGWRDHEYVSLGVDHLPVLAGRTPIQARFWWIPCPGGRTA